MTPHPLAVRCTSRCVYVAEMIRRTLEGQQRDVIFYYSVVFILLVCRSDSNKVGRAVSASLAAAKRDARYIEQLGIGGNYSLRALHLCAGINALHGLAQKSLGRLSTAELAAVIQRFEEDRLGIDIYGFIKMQYTVVCVLNWFGGLGDLIGKNNIEAVVANMEATKTVPIQ